MVNVGQSNLIVNGRTVSQWQRLYRNIHRRVVRSDMFGADWRTLMSTNPQGFMALRFAYLGLRFASSTVLDSRSIA